MRRSGSFARQVLVGRVGPRRGEPGLDIAPADAALPGSAIGSRLNRLRVRRVSGVPGNALAGNELVDLDAVPVDASTLAPLSPGVPRNVDAEAPPLSIPLLPGERTTARRIRFALVNACTIASLMLGMSAIFLAVNQASVTWAALCLIACVVFDGLDGALARKFGVASPFGAQMDSLADMCSFGIAAPVVVYAWLAGSAPAAVVVPACSLVAVCAAIRLARFNVSPKDGRFFCGVPTTMAASVLALGTLIAPDLPAGVRVAAVAVLGLAMVSSFPYAKLARMLRLPPWMLAIPIVGAMIDYRLTFVLVVLAYLVSGPLLWLRHRQAA